MAARLKPAAAALLGWATDAALPLWATAGFDVEHGRFEERLTLRAERLPDVPIRLLSQARQIYAYALAARRGWYPGAAALVEQAYASMVRDYRRTGRAGRLDLLDPARRRRRRPAPRLLRPYLRAAGDRVLCPGDRQAAGARRGRRNFGVHRPPSPGGQRSRLPGRPAAVRWPAPAEPAHAHVRGASVPLGVFRATRAT